MDKTYDELVKKQNKKAKSTRKIYLDCFVSFFVGGLIGMFGEWLVEEYCLIFHISRSDSIAYMIITLIFIASLLTALGVFDKLASKVKCGVLIPITGFAHSMTSAAMDARSEGLIRGLGANIFKLGGTVILYGIVSAWVFGILRYLVGGLS